MSPNNGSSGACGTVSAENTVGVEDAMWFLMLSSLNLYGKEDPEEIDIVDVLGGLSLSRNVVPGTAGLPGLRKISFGRTVINLFDFVPNL